MLNLKSIKIGIRYLQVYWFSENQVNHKRVTNHTALLNYRCFIEFEDYFRGIYRFYK